MKYALIAAATALLAPTCAWAAECTGEHRQHEEITPSISVLGENDMFNGSNDRNYTSGLQVSVLSEWRLDPCIEDILDTLTPTRRDQEWVNGVSFTNLMFTPEDLTVPGPIVNDRPYAGVTALTFSAFAFNKPPSRDSDDRSFDEISLSIGAIGDASGADDLQSWWHKSVLHIGVPAGWETNQVDDALLLQLDYQRTAGVDADRHDGLDLTWNYGFGVGTYADYAHAGANLRLGVNMRGDVGPPRIAPGPHGSGHWQPDPDGPYLGGYVFVGFDQRYVAYDHTLDEYPSQVDRRDWVTDFQWGWVLHVGGVRFSGVYITRERQFRGQPEEDTFGAYSATVSLCGECYSLRRRDGSLRPLIALSGR